MFRWVVCWGRNSWLLRSCVSSLTRVMPLPRPRPVNEVELGRNDVAIGGGRLVGDVGRRLISWAFTSIIRDWTWSVV